MNKSEIREEIFKLVYSLEVQDSKNEEQIDVYLEDSEISEKSNRFQLISIFPQSIIIHYYCFNFFF